MCRVPVPPYMCLVLLPGNNLFPGRFTAVEWLTRSILSAWSSSIITNNTICAYPFEIAGLHFASSPQHRYIIVQRGQDMAESGLERAEHHGRNYGFVIPRCAGLLYVLDSIAFRIAYRRVVRNYSQISGRRKILRQWRHRLLYHSAENRFFRFRVNYRYKYFSSAGAFFALSIAETEMQPRLINICAIVDQSMEIRW